MGFQKPISAPLSTSSKGSAPWAAPKAGMYPGKAKPSAPAFGASAKGSQYSAPSLKSNTHDAKAKMQVSSPMGGLKKRKPGAKKTFPAFSTAKTYISKAHAPSANIKSANGGQVFNYETGKQNVGNPTSPRKLVSANMKGSAFYGQ